MSSPALGGNRILDAWLRAREARQRQEDELKSQIETNLVSAVHTMCLAEAWKFELRDDGLAIITKQGLSPLYINTRDIVRFEKHIGFR